MTSSATNCFPLLALPAELRNRIYRFVLVKGEHPFQNNKLSIAAKGRLGAIPAPEDDDIDEDDGDGRILIANDWDNLIGPQQPALLQVNK